MLYALQTCNRQTSHTQSKTALPRGLNLSEEAFVE